MNLALVALVKNIKNVVENKLIFCDMNTFNMIIACPDKKGIIYDITSFLFSLGANIIELEQHIEDSMFFMRIKWQMNSSLSKDDFLQKIQGLQQKFNLTIKLDNSGASKKLGLFCSKELHCLIDVLGKAATNELNISIEYVISNHKNVQSLVEKFNIPFFYIPTKKGSFQHESECLKVMNNYQTDFIGLARYMKILSGDFLQNAQQKIINVHHSFLPSFIGANPYEEAYERGVKLIGATSHYVTEELDQGPIIEQVVRRIKHSHNIKNLKLMGKESEKEVFAFAIRKHLENKLIVYKNRTIVFE